MTELDFLPQWYQVRQERRRSYLAFVWLGACLVGVMGLSFNLIQNKIAQCQADRDQVLSEQNSVRDQLVQLDKLKATRDDMHRKAEIADRLANCPDAIHLLRRLAELVPDNLGLMELEMNSETIKESVQPAPGGAGADLGAGGGTPGSARSGLAGPSGAPAQSPSGQAAHPAQVDRQRYTLRITGAAPFDTLVTHFVDRLSHSDAFTDVQLTYTKDVTLAGKLVRKFELTCKSTIDWEATDKNVPQILPAVREVANREVGTGSKPVPPESPPQVTADAAPAPMAIESNWLPTPAAKEEGP